MTHQTSPRSLHQDQSIQFSGCPKTSKHTTESCFQAADRIRQKKHTNRIPITKNTFICFLGENFGEFSRNRDHLRRTCSSTRSTSICSPLKPSPGHSRGSRPSLGQPMQMPRHPVRRLLEVKLCGKSSDGDRVLWELGFLDGRVG